MTNIVEQIEHPAIKEMRGEMAAKYEVEIANLTKRAEEAEGRVENSESSIADQVEVMENAWKKIIENGGGDLNKGKISLGDLQKELAEFSAKRWQRDWSILEDMVKLLDHVEIPSSVETRYEQVEVLPSKISINGISYTKN